MFTSQPVERINVEVAERSRSLAVQAERRAIAQPNVEKKPKPRKVIGEGDERVGPDKATGVEVDADVDEDQYLSGNVDEHGEPTTVHHQASKEIYEEDVRPNIPDVDGKYPDGTHRTNEPGDPHDRHGAHKAAINGVPVEHLDLAAAPGVTLAPAPPGLAEVTQVDVREGAAAFRRPPLTAGRVRSTPETTWPTGRQ